MARLRRLRCKKLAAKLLQIRESFGLTQTQMVEALEMKPPLSHLSISRYENGRLEPPLPILLRYARLVGISTDLLIDDERELPKREEGNR